LMPTKSGAEMMRNYLEWIQGQAGQCNPASDPHSSSFAPALTLRKLVSNLGGTKFVALLPLGCTFDEMVMVDASAGSDCDDDVDPDAAEPSESSSPDAFGFDSVLDKPLEMSCVVEMLSRLRESISMIPPQNPQQHSTKITNSSPEPLLCSSSLASEPSPFFPFVQILRQFFSRKVYPA
jgi:hypothetical protein